MVFLKFRLLALFIAGNFYITNKKCPKSNLVLAMETTQVQTENLLLDDENYTSKIHEMKGSALEIIRSICPKNAENLVVSSNNIKINVCERIATSSLN